MNELGENPVSFEETIALNQPMTPQQAIETLAAFHGVTAESVTNDFTSLKVAQEGTVVTFGESAYSGSKAIIMKGCGPQGNFLWYHLLNKDTGKLLSKAA